MPTIAELTEQITLAEGKLTTLSTQLKDATTKVAKLELAIGEKTTALDKADEELKSLRDEKAKRDERDLSARVDEAFDTWKDKKGLTDKSKKSMLIVLKADPEQFEQDYPRVKANERHLLRNNVAGNENRRDPNSIPRQADVEGAPVVQMREMDLADLAIRLSAEKGIPLDEAQELVLSGVTH